MRSLFITDTLLSRIDTGIISGFLGLTFYRMLNQFYDLEGHCIWDYKLLEADIYDSCFRTIMYNASLYLYDFFNQRVYMYIYIYIYKYIESRMLEQLSKRN